MSFGGGEVIGSATYNLDLDSGDFERKSRQAEQTWERVGQRIDHVGQRISRAGRSLTIGLTAPIIAAGVAATKITGDFDTSLSHIQGLVGDSAEAVAAFREEVLALAPAVGRGPKELADALYFVRSSGIAAESSMAVVKASAEGAAAGLGDTATVAQAVTSAMNAYGIANLSAAQATSILIATVREGKAEPEELANSIGRVIPIAAQLGVSFDQVGAALASMTLFGLDTEESATALRGVFATLLKPSAQAAEILGKVGLSAEGLRRQLREEGLLAVLTTLSTVLAGNEDALAAVIPNVRALTGFLSIAGKNADQVERIFAELAATTENDLAKAFEVASETTGFKFKQAMAQAQVAAIRFGDVIAPIITGTVIPAMMRALTVLEELIAFFRTLPREAQIGIGVFVAMAAAIGPLLILIGAMASGLGAIIALLPALKAAALFMFAGGPWTIGIAAVALAAVGLAGTLLILSSNTDKASDAALRFESTWLRVAARVVGGLNDVEKGLLNIITLGNAELLGDTAFDRLLADIKAKQSAVDAELLGRQGLGGFQSNDLTALQGAAGGSGFGAGLNAALGGIGSTAKKTTPTLEDYGGGIDLTGDAAETALEKIDPLADGIISLAEAIEANLTPAQAAALEMERVDALVRFDLADALFRQEVATIKAADAGRTYINSLIAIQAELLRSGRTAADFIRDISADALDAARTLAGQIVGRPTRESLELELQQSTLRRQRLLLIQGGAADDDKRVKKIDDEIAALQTTIDLRREEFNILRLKNDLANATIDTDREAAAAMAYLTQVVGGLSYAIVATTNQLSGFAPHAQPLHSGIERVPHPMTARLATGEGVLNARDNAQRLLGAGTPAPMLAPVVVNVYADMTDGTIRKVAAAVEQAQTRVAQRWRGSVIGGRSTNG